MKTYKLFPKLMTFVVVAFIFNALHSQTTINPGTVSGTWNKAGSPYLITGNIEIPVGSSLTINSGVNVEFQGEYKLAANGTISINGEAGDSVKFTAANPSTGWRGLRITGPSADTVCFDYCIFEFAKAPYNVYPESKYGAITIQNNAVLKISNSRISNNTGATDGCGINSVNSVLILENNLFKDNDNGTDGGAVNSTGSYVYIDGNRFVNNTSATYYSKGGGINSEMDSSLTISNNLFAQNSVERIGGGISIYGTSPALIISNVFLENESRTMGGAIGIAGTSAKITNNLICKNIALQSGLYSSGGGGLKIMEANVELINNTIADNTDYQIFTAGSKLDFTNTLLSDAHATGNPVNVYVYDYNTEPSSLDFQNCILEGGMETIFHRVGYDTIIGDTVDCLYGSPNFLDWENNMYQVDFNSIAINSGILDTSGLGLPAFDLDSNDRIIGGIVDIGAFEFANSILNRVPKIEIIPDYAIRPNDSINLAVVFSDADLGDTHTIQLKTSNSSFGLAHLSGNVSGSTFTVVPPANTNAITQVTVVVSDNSAAENSADSIQFQVHVMGDYDQYSNSIDHPMVWNTNLVRIHQNTDISIGSYVIIKPGTLVEFQGQYTLSVHGQLIAEGAESDSIYFDIKNNSAGLVWDGVSFPFNIHNSDYPPDILSVIDHCVIENASTGLEINHLENIFIANSDIRHCGLGIYCEGGATIKNCDIHHNTGSYYGSGLFLDDYNRGAISVSNCRIHHNTGAEEGGGINCEGDDVSLVGNLVYDNQAALGGGICINGSARLVNNTIAFNRAEKGGAVWQDGYYHTIYLNNIFQYNSASSDGNQIYCATSAELVDLYHNYIEGGMDEVYVYYNKHQINSSNNYFSNSSFLDTTTRNFYLHASSICINAGVLDTMLLKGVDQNLVDSLVIYDGRIDIGALEFIGTPQNRLPIIKKTDRIYLKPDSVSTVSIGFIELDSGDSLKAQIQTTETEVEIANLFVDSSNIHFDIERDAEWTGVFDIVVKLYDKADSLASCNTDTIEIVVSNTNEYCGIYTDDLLWDADTILVACDVTIGRNAVLEIAKGTVVQFADSAALVVEGVIKALGGTGDSITFTSQGKPWAGILVDRFDEYSELLGNPSFFRYCIIENTDYRLFYGLEGGVTIRRGEVKLEHSRISHNQNTAMAVYYGRPINPIITNNTFSYNKNMGLVIWGAPMVHNNIFEHNQALVDGTYQAVAIKIMGGEPEIHNNIVRYNNGGAMEVGGHGLDIDARITNNRIYSNTSNHIARIGGICCHNLEWGSTAYIVGNLIYGNHTINGEGGGISVRNSNYPGIYVYNNTIVNNNSDILGGGVNIGRSSRAELANNIIWGNTANGVSDQVGFSYLSSLTTISNCAIEFGLDSLRGRESAVNSVVDTMVWDGFPNFVDYRNNNFKLLGNSYCINSGKTDTAGLFLPTFDIVGNPRIASGVVDLGAYEYVPNNCGTPGFTLTTKICQGEVIEMGGSVYSESGTYQQNLKSVDGCDSIVVLNLEVMPRPEIHLGNDTIIDSNNPLTLSVEGDFSEILWNNGAKTKQYIVEGVAGEIKQVWVKAMDINGCSNSDTITVTIHDFNSIAANFGKYDVNVFPNPTSGFMHVQFKKGLPGRALVEIQSLSGQVVFRKTISNKRQTFDVSGIPQGMYIICIYSDETMLMQGKLVLY